MIPPIARYQSLIAEVQRNVASYEKYGVPWEPLDIGFERNRPANYLEQLHEIEEQIFSCRSCMLASDRFRRQGKSVPGGGNPDAKIMVIGEGPGKHEERYVGPESPDIRFGFPFVGASGSLLNRMLGYLGLDRSDVYISNITHCRAAIVADNMKFKDRRPSITEVAACFRFVKRQIELVQPWLILAFGSIAATPLLNIPITTPLVTFKDKLHTYHFDPRIKVWPSYHPAYYLHTEGSDEDGVSTVSGGEDVAGDNSNPETLHIGTALRWRPLRAILKKANVIK